MSTSAIPGASPALPPINTTSTSAAASYGNTGSAASKVGRKPTKAEVEKVAVEFEAMFLSAMLQPMFEKLKSNKTFGGGHGEDMFRPMLVDEYAKSMAKSGQVGIAKSIRDQMLRLQEVSE
jgi:flagellar protein FlgJ